MSYTAGNKLAALTQLLQWLLTDQGQSVAGAAVQGLPFYAEVKDWTDENLATFNQWVGAVTGANTATDISVAEATIHLREMHPLVNGLADLFGVSPGSTNVLLAMALTISQANERSALIHTDTQAIVDRVDAILGVDQTTIQDQLTTLRTGLEDYANTSDDALVQVIDQARGEIMTNANTQAGYEFAYHEQEKQIALANLHAARDALTAAITAARDSINGYTGLRTDAIDGALAQQVADLTALIDGVIVAVNGHTDEVRTSLNSDLDVKLQATADGINEAGYYQSIDVRDHAATVVDQAVTDIAGHVETVGELQTAQVLASEIVVTDRIDNARIIIDAIDARVVDLPAVIKQDADAQTAWVLDGLQPQVNALPAVIKADADAQTAWVLDHMNERTAELTNPIAATQEMHGEQLSGISNVVQAIEFRQHAPFGGIQTDEITFDGQVEWVSEADFYEVLIDQIPPGRPRVSLGDEDYLPHAGWCALKHGQSYERGPALEFTHNTVLTAKLRATGILLYVRAGTTGVIRAYTLE